MSTIDLGLVKGRGISSIEKTDTQGSVDTYTIYYTDNTTSTFEVTNGSGGNGGNYIAGEGIAFIPGGIRNIRVGDVIGPETVFYYDFDRTETVNWMQTNMQSGDNQTLVSTDGPLSFSSYYMNFGGSDWVTWIQWYYDNYNYDIFTDGFDGYVNLETSDLQNIKTTLNKFENCTVTSVDENSWILSHVKVDSSTLISSLEEPIAISLDPNYRKPTIMGVLDLGSLEGFGRAGILVTNEDLIKQYEWEVYYSTSVSNLPTNYYDDESSAHVVTSNVFEFKYPASSYHVTVKINAIDKNGAVCDSSILYIGRTGNFAQTPS